MTDNRLVSKVQFWHMEIPFQKPFKHALKERTSSESVFLKVTLSDGTVGYGEALPRDYVTGESVESVMRTLKNNLLPDLMLMPAGALSASDVENLSRRWLESPQTRDSLTAIGAVELALVDALSKRSGKTVYEWLGVSPQSKAIRYSMVLSCGDEKKLLKHVLLSRLLMINDLKLKVTANAEDTRSALRVIRKIHPSANLRVDANCDWDVAQSAEHMRMMQDFGVQSVEQPFAKNNIDDAAKLVRDFPGVLICADESLCSYEQAQSLIQKKAATSFNIRITKQGGLFNSLRIYNLAKENGLRCQLGAQVGETSVLSLYGRVFAAITGDLVYHEGSFGTRLLKEDVCAKPIQFGFGGMASTAVRGLGIGADIDDARILKHAQRCVEQG
jgi:L-alanine-DL-glutamate epimerase-like enolase superfamily enzyme